MDKRKINFLLRLQKEIDKIETKEGETRKVEQLKARFYDLVELDDSAKLPLSSPSLSHLINKLDPDKRVFLSEEDINDILLQLPEALESNEYITNPINETILPRKVLWGSRFSLSRRNDDVIHKPIETRNLLNKFESSDGLKFLTHAFDDPDQEFNRDIIVQKAKEEFQQHDTDNIPLPLKQRIKAFAFSEDPNWFTWLDGEKFDSHLGWNGKEVKEWCRNPLNKGKHPIDFAEFENKMIVPFKRSIQVRDGQLPSIVERAIKKGFKKITMDYIKLDNSLAGVKFFTNVEAIEFGLRYIFASMEQRLHENSKVFITVQKNIIINKARFRVLKITHIDSFCDKSSDENILGGDLMEAKKRFTGYCNWSIEAQFEDGTFRKTILSDIEVPEIQPVESVEGFTHLLYFYA